MINLNFDEVERLALLSIKGDMRAKEELAENFKPFILNLAKKSYIHGFEFEDIVNECYNSLFNCLSRYNPDKHRFVAYATISIKNSVGLLIRLANKRNETDGAATLILTDNLEHVVSNDKEFIEDEVIKKIDIDNLKKAISELSHTEKNLVDYVFLKKHTLKQYSLHSNLNYSKVVNKKNSIINKLKFNIKNGISISGN